jgi:hypothetical protein
MLFPLAAAEKKPQATAKNQPITPSRLRSI